MSLGSKRAFATIAAAAALAAGIGVGSAGGAKPGAHGAVLKAAVQYIGVSRAQLLQDARAGQTLAQIATAHGKSVAGLEAAMLAAIKAKLEARNLTPAQQQAKLARAEKLVDRLVNAKLAGRKQRTAKAGLLRVSAKYVGVTPQALRAGAGRRPRRTLRGGARCRRRRAARWLDRGRARRVRRRRH